MGSGQPKSAENGLNFIAVMAFLFACAAGAETKADNPLSSTVAPKQQLIDGYMKSAFARGDQLIRPNGIPRVAFYCPGDFCASSVLRLKSDFPKFVKITDTSSEESSSEILVLFFPNVTALENSRVEYQRPQGSEFEFLNSGACRLARYKTGPEVIKVIIFVALEGNPKASEACVLTEAMRGTGLEFQDTYEHYSKRLVRLSDKEFESEFVLGTVNLMKLHWTAPTSPGNKPSVVREILKKFIKSANLQ